LSKVRIAISDIFDEDTIALNEIALLDSIIETLHLRKSVIDTTLQSGLAGSDSLSLLNESVSIFNEIAGNLQRQNILFAQLNEQRQSKIDSAISYNNNVSASTDIEVNSKGVNEIFLDKIVNEDYQLDSAQLATLQSISIQCPFSGGRSVYTARVILRMLGDTTLYIDTTLCAGLGIRFAKNQKTENLNFFIKVIPNPVNENCTFQYLLPEDKEGKIEIYNLLYEKIEELAVKKNSLSQTYQTNKLVSGLYAIRLVVDGSRIGQVKMSVVK